MKQIRALYLLPLLLLAFVAGGCGSKGSGNSWDDNSLIPISKNGKEGFIDWQGNIVITPQYKWVNYFSKDGLARVQNDEGLYGYIDKEGTVVIPAQYASAGDFSEGIAFVAREGEHLQAIDKNGNMLFICEKASGVKMYKEGLAVYRNREGKYGAMDKNGNDAIFPTFANIQCFSEGLAPFQNESGKWGFINKEGQYEINPQFDNVLGFSEGYAPIIVDDEFGYINKKGERVIAPQFLMAGPFNNGIAAVAQGFAMGYINKKGQFIVNPQYDTALPFEGNIAVVKEKDSNYFGVIDKKGKMVVSPQFKSVGDIRDGKLFVYDGSKWGVVNSKGKYVVNPMFEHLKFNYTNRLFDYFELTNSQYYDATELTKSLEQLLGKESGAVGGFSQNTTYGDLRASGPEHHVNSYSDTEVASITEHPKLAEGIEVSEYKVTYDGDLVLRRSFFGGTTYNLKSRPTNVLMVISIDKEHQLYLPGIKSAIGKQLAKQYTVVEEGNAQSNSSKPIKVSLDNPEPGTITLTFYFPEHKEDEEGEPTGTNGLSNNLSSNSKAEKATEATSTAKRGKVDTKKPTNNEATWKSARVNSYNGYIIIRDSPSENGEILNTIDNGTSVEAMPIGREWCKIKWKGQVVYALRNELSF